jgi:hypothetical protein
MLLIYCAQEADKGVFKGNVKMIDFQRVHIDDTSEPD